MIVDFLSSKMLKYFLLLMTHRRYITEDIGSKIFQFSHSKPRNFSPRQGITSGISKTETNEESIWKGCHRNSIESKRVSPINLLCLASSIIEASERTRGPRVKKYITRSFIENFRNEIGKFKYDGIS